jgi:ribulose-5-phosphate 4-epimerase/fuculose-1-phosphate aldolase
MLQGSVVYGQKLAEAVVLLIIVDRLAGCRCRVLEARKSDPF